MFQFIEKDGGLTFNVRVVPRASKSEVVGDLDGALKIKLKSPPVDGAANAELARVLAKFFDVPENAVEILKGQTSKNKQIKIIGLQTAKLPDIKTA